MAKRTLDGNIRKRADGRWEARYTAGYDPRTGKQLQKSVYANTQKDAKAKLRNALNDLDKVKLESDNKKLGEWMDTWMTDYKSNDLKSSTYEIYQRIIRLNIKPKLGEMKLTSITTADLQWFINELQNDGVRHDDQEGGLSPASVTKIRNVLHGAFEQAQRNRMIQSNPTEGIVLPKQRKKEIVHLSPDQEQRFIAALEGSLRPLYILALASGLRRGELLGLTWDCIDFDNRMLIVNKTAQRVYDPDTQTHKKDFSDTKTYTSNRKVPLIESVLPILQAHREEQSEMKKTMGTKWNPSDLVFCTSTGAIVDTTSVRRILQRTLRKAELPDMGIHALRHTFATRLLEQGVPAKVVQEFLGHTDVALTLNTYTHVTQDTATKEIKKLDDYYKQQLSVKPQEPT